MSEEQVLFHSEEANVTVTEDRVIYGDEVFDIGSIKHAAWCNSEGFKDYLIAVGFAIVGIICLIQFNWWSALGAILLLNPIMVFFVKNKYWVFIYMKSGSTIDDGEGTSKKMFKKDVAKGVSNAVNQAVQRHRTINDPRKGLKL